MGDLGLIPGLGRSHGEGHGNPLQYSCLENTHGQRAWWAKVQGVGESDVTERLSTQYHVPICRTFKFDYFTFCIIISLLFFFKKFDHWLLFIFKINFIDVWFTYYKIHPVWMCSLIIFRKCILFYNNHHNPVLELFHGHLKTRCTFLQSILALYWGNTDWFVYRIHFWLF